MMELILANNPYWAFCWSFVRWDQSYPGRSTRDEYSIEAQYGIISRVKSTTLAKITRGDDQYENSLTEREVHFANTTKELYELRMKTQIMEYVMDLTVGDAEAFINDHRPSQFYGEILRIRLIRYSASRRAMSAAEQNPNMEIPEGYGWCHTSQEYLGQLSVSCLRFGLVGPFLGHCELQLLTGLLGFMSILLCVCH
jgi:hypothetical protein